MNHPARLAAATCLAMLSLPSAQATCYTVVDSAERVVYQSMQAPFDISGSLAQQVARNYSPQHHLLMMANAYCPGVGQPSGVYGAPLPGSRIDGNVSPTLRLADSGATWPTAPARATESGWTATPAPAPLAQRNRAAGR